MPDVAACRTLSVTRVVMEDIRREHTKEVGGRDGRLGEGSGYLCPLVRSHGCRTVRHAFSVGMDVVCARGPMRDVVTLLLAFVSDISISASILIKSACAPNFREPTVS
jgi:hypothetical protein